MRCCKIQKQNRPAGFTLIEMLVVFLVIAILIGILVPVIAGAFARGREAQEITEINVLVTNLEQLKDRFQHYPPSQLILREDGDYSMATLSSYVNGGVESPVPPEGVIAVYLRDISIQYLKLFWPQIVLNVSTSAGDSAYVADRNGNGQIDPDEFFDWNGDGVFQDGATFFLSGDECLVFFLGGIPHGKSRGTASICKCSNQGPSDVFGFSKDPRNPTIPPIAGTSATSRDGPYAKFASERLVDWDLNGFFEFLPARKPGLTGGYAYFSAYDGTGYRPDDMNIQPTQTEPSGVNSLAELDSNHDNNPGQIPNDFIAFRVNWRLPTNPSGTSILYPSDYTYTGTGAGLTTVKSPGPNPYTVGAPFSTTIAIARYHKPESFQLISPGFDQQYGQGGAAPRLGQSAASSIPQYDELRVDVDDDNLTNLSGGKLRDFGN